MKTIINESPAFKFWNGSKMIDFDFKSDLILSSINRDGAQIVPNTGKQAANRQTQELQALYEYDIIKDYLGNRYIVVFCPKRSAFLAVNWMPNIDPTKHLKEAPMISEFKLKRFRIMGNYLSQEARRKANRQKSFF